MDKIITAPSIHDRGLAKFLFACPGEEDQVPGLSALMHWTGHSIDDITRAHLPLFKPDFSVFKAMFYVSYPDGTIPQRIVQYADFFYNRDGAEALVFEFDRFTHHYVWRSFAALHLRVKVSK